MRINLKVPFAQKDAAKELGARWDAVRKIWYVIDPELLEVFADWIPTEDVSLSKTGIGAATSSSSQGILTGPRSVKPICQCAVLPWDDCEHSPV